MKKYETRLGSLILLGAGYAYGVLDLSPWYALVGVFVIWLLLDYGESLKQKGS